MLVGQKLGPFLIDRELGSGAMGTVYRGRYEKNGQVLAIKVMSPGLGTTNATALDRFEREAEILKQLKHPNIVRLFGVGKTQGMRYYAMEYIEGESLDRVMARRDRMSWEEVVELGLQLCAALQHAHEKGIVHRDLKPSNLMMLRDGTLKLTDFGIAKDLDETQLTSTNCTVGTAAYMSPEQCRGERNLTHKSDLYSLGVLFYELVTGRKPFQSDNAMELFLLHCNGTCERPSRLVMGLPAWLDTLICQLLEKKPEQRPLDAAMVATVLSTIREKVESKQSAGEELAHARRGDLPPEKRQLSEEDREAARALKGKKGKKKKKKADQRQVWAQAGGLLLGLLLVLGTLTWFLWPPSAEKLFREAERLMASSDPEQWKLAREKPIRDYLSRFGQTPGEQTDKVRFWADTLDANRAEEIVDRHLRRKASGRGLQVQAHNKAEEIAFTAAEAEVEGDEPRARKLWQEVLQQWDDVPERDRGLRIDLVARRHLADLDGLSATARGLQALFQELIRTGEEPTLEPLQATVFAASRYEKVGDLLMAQEKLAGLVEQLTKEQAARDQPSKESPQRSWLLFTSVELRRVKDELKKKPQTRQDRKAQIRKFVEGVAARLEQTDVVLREQRALCMHVIALYDKDPEMASEVHDARELQKKIADRMK
jgi:serine/threonine-protein kinase